MNRFRKLNNRLPKRVVDNRVQAGSMGRLRKRWLDEFHLTAND